MSKEELKTLREFIDVFMKRRQIQESMLLVGVLVMFVPKKNRKKRLVVDYQRLNNITIKDKYTIPLVDKIREQLKKAKQFTLIDLQDRYYHLYIKKGDKWKTAFRTRYRHYEFTIMPIRLTNTIASFQRWTNNVLQLYLDQFVLVYLDNILVFLEELIEYIGQVKKVLDEIRKAGFYISPKKSKFHV